METTQAVKAFAALAQENRLEIIKLLIKEGEKGLCPCHLIEEFGFSNANLSFHLKELENATLVKKEKRGKFIHYSANCDFIKQIGDSLLTECTKFNCNKGEK